jgi:predicted nucleic acid-binding Zn ribbon protein
MLEHARADARKGRQHPARATGSGRSGGRSRAQPELSGAGVDDRDPELVGEVVERIVVDRGWQASRAVGGVEGRWGQIVGQDIAEHCRPDSYADGLLTVRADSTAWATQVRMLADTLLCRLNDDLGAGTVTSLRVLGPTGPSWKKGRLAVKGRGPRDTYG